ncbi:hypothetical protein Pcinc_001961 [Petrolisthes cinctipes]|uniref:Uncharacterized protein n=1 Tax=Petrolisthes cinctipes TaxID=88211 RepID=A0AAE1GLY5_PETCI|nr:hypothetical protein Pcinc_001961 [Petrolisthes cinctipes]
MTTPLENVDSDEPTQPTLMEEDSDFAPSPVGESPRRPGPSHTPPQLTPYLLELLLVPKSCISYATSRIRGGRKRLREEGKMQREEGKSKREEEETTSGSLRYLQPCQLITQMSHHRVMYNLSHRHLPLRQEQIKDTHGISTLRLLYLLLSRPVHLQLHNRQHQGLLQGQYHLLSQNLLLRAHPHFKPTLPFKFFDSGVVGGKIFRP